MIVVGCFVIIGCLDSVLFGVVVSIVLGVWLGGWLTFAGCLCLFVIVLLFGWLGLF